MKKILLTGAYGMVGKNILEHPLATGFEWFTPTRNELDLRDRVHVEAYLEKNKPEMIIHAAGVVGGIQANMREPVRFFIDNLDIGRNIIMAAREKSIRRLLNLSCSCMYPRATAMPMQESSILTGELEPTNEGYALARIAAERLCEYIVKEDPSYLYKTMVACNLYGRHDKFDPKHSHMIPAVIAKLHHAKENALSSIDIWGDGKTLREFMYAGDLADCVLKSISEFETLPFLSNVGPGLEVSINEYYRIISQIVGFKGEFIHDLSKPSGMTRKVVDPTRIHAWGWKAKTELEEGLKKTYDFYLSQGNLA